MDIDFINKITEDEEIIYHYTSLKFAQNHILKDLKLLASPLKNVNDPKEYKDKFFIHTSDINMKELNNKVNQYFLNYSKIICFTQDNGRTHYEAGYFKSRMWSQYGEKHKGVCLGFKKSKILELFSRTNECFWKGQRNIHYTNDIHTRHNLYKLPFTQDNISDEIDEINEITAYLGKSSDHFYFEKVKDWQDENEYRLVFLNIGNEEFYFNIGEALHSIYLGLDFPKEKICELKNTIPSKDIKLYKLGQINTLIYPKDITDREY